MTREEPIHPPFDPKEIPTRQNPTRTNPDPEPPPPFDPTQLFKPPTR